MKPHEAHHCALFAETVARAQVHDMQKAHRGMRAYLARQHRERRAALERMQREMRAPSGGAVVVSGACLVIIGGAALWLFLTLTGV